MVLFVDDKGLDPGIAQVLKISPIFLGQPDGRRIEYSHDIPVGYYLPVSYMDIHMLRAVPMYDRSRRANQSS